jgi:hypothetical protein
MPACDTTTSEANRARAHQINQLREHSKKPTIHYAKVAATIASVAPGAQSFDGTGENTTPGDIVFTTAGEDNQRHQFRMARKLVWLECPSTAASPKESGVLYISEVGLNVVSEDSPPSRIAGSTPDSHGHLLLSLKWPDPGPEETTSPLRIWPTSILVAGYAFNDPLFHSASVELLDGSLAGFEQTIDFSRGTEIQLNLTQLGLVKFQAAGVNVKALLHALKLVATKFNNDTQDRAAAWMLIARTQLYLETYTPQDHSELALKSKLKQDIHLALDGLKRAQEEVVDRPQQEVLNGNSP